MWLEAIEAINNRNVYDVDPNDIGANDIDAYLEDDPYDLNDLETIGIAAKDNFFPQEIRDVYLSVLIVTARDLWNYLKNTQESSNKAKNLYNEAVEFVKSKDFDYVIKIIFSNAPLNIEKIRNRFLEDKELVHRVAKMRMPGQDIEEQQQSINVGHLSSPSLC